MHIADGVGLPYYPRNSFVLMRTCATDMLLVFLNVCMVAPVNRGCLSSRLFIRLFMR